MPTRELPEPKERATQELITMQSLVRTPVTFFSRFSCGKGGRAVLAGALLSVTALASVAEPAKDGGTVNEIKQGAVAVGHGVRDGAVEVGHDVKDGAVQAGHAAAKLGVGIGHAARDSAKAVGHASRDAAKSVGKAVKEAVKETKSSDD
jgi:hypothetical protein